MKTIVKLKNVSKSFDKDNYVIKIYLWRHMKENF